MLPLSRRGSVGECSVREVRMSRLAAILLAVTGTVALQVVAQAVVLASVRVVGRRTRGLTELRRTFWISLGAVLPLFFGHFAQVGLWAGFLVLLGALQTYNDAFYFSLVTFATLGYGDIVLAPGYRIFGALGATCGRGAFPAEENLNSQTVPTLRGLAQKLRAGRVGTLRR